MPKPIHKTNIPPHFFPFEDQPIPKFPKIIKIGNSAGFVISKILLKSINWEKGDFIDYEYNGNKKKLIVRNFSAEQREHDAIYREDRTNY